MPSPIIKPNSPYIDAYYQTLDELHARGIYGELQTRHAFANLLQPHAKDFNWLFVPEHPLPNRKRPDATFLSTEFDLTYGYWESKGPEENLDRAIRAKKTFYPLTNIIFENSKIAQLYQEEDLVCEIELQDRHKLADLLTQFFSYDPQQNKDFLRTWQALSQEPKASADPDADSANVLFRITRKILESIRDDYLLNPTFQQAFDTFHQVCQKTLDPTIKKEEIESMLAQHLLTERISASVFPDRDLRRENSIARELEEVVKSLNTYTDIQTSYLKDLTELYKKIKEVVKKLFDFEAKHRFLSRVYEGFFKQIAPDQADTHGIVYTPQPIVGFMLASVEHLLQKEFGTSLAAQDVVILDPCVGTGTFIMQLLRMLPRERLPAKYATEIFCNEVMLLPYYIAALSIEQVYYEEMGHYEPFEGICFTDTLELVRDRKTETLSKADAARVEREKAAKITVIIGNPPYNVGQKNENDNNKNRRYLGRDGINGVDDRIKATYAKDSRATLKATLYDAYVKFFRWATDRLEGEDGIVCFVSNNSFLEGLAFDGFRKHLNQDFTKIYHLDLGGNVRKKQIGNVFGIMVSVGITIAVRNRQSPQNFLRYFRLPEHWKKEERLSFLTKKVTIEQIEWQELQPNAKHIWLTEGLLDSFETFLPMGTKEAKAQRSENVETIFKVYSNGAKTNRDSVVYDFNYQTLKERIQSFIIAYNAEVSHWIEAGQPENTDDFVSYGKIKWSHFLKKELERGRIIQMRDSAIRLTLYRPFVKQYLYYDKPLIDVPGLTKIIFPTANSETENMAICVAGLGDRKGFGCFMCNAIPGFDLAFEKAQCFPFYTYAEDGSERQENITEWAVKQFEAQYGPLPEHAEGKVSASSTSGPLPELAEGKVDSAKKAIFYYIYALLHHPTYRERYAKNLKLALPRIPLVANRAAFLEMVEIGFELAQLHLFYEQQTPYPLRRVEKSTLWTERVEKMKLIEEKTALVVNAALTLKEIPPECFEYKLGNRSALEWVIEQYRVKQAQDGSILSDPNRAEDPHYIVRLVGQVVTVSVQTVALVKRLAKLAL